ncbi:MAG: hypothetical protein LQ350_006001 [Teloschistes chrysophthalmus]|nr:MAG: hypothetical protein LQ350_006001 [Niorma chrysophthalma]
MCGITAAITLAGRSGYSKTTSATNGGLDAAGGSKRRTLSNGHSSQTSIDLKSQLASSLDAIKHRGPDSYGTWTSPDGNIGLGSCRLAINGLGPGGDQPFTNSDGTIHAVVNGELYDHQRIRNDMVKLSGFKFRGGSDSEIVVALYEYYGVSFLSKLRGEFALCIYDSKKQLFLAARDRSGVKPLFWTIHDGRLLLASEAKALLPFDWLPEWDVRSIIDLGWFTEERTIFKGLRKIRPGHYITCLSLDHISEGQYWDHDYPDKDILETRSEAEMVEGVRERLLDAVRVRLQADVPVGIHLSGGIDSSVIAGMAKHLLDKGEVKLGNDGTHRLRCLGVAFDETSGKDESGMTEYEGLRVYTLTRAVIAQRTADFLGVDFQKAQMNEAELATNFEEAVWFDEQPHFELGFVGKHALSKLTRDSGIKTIISGQGSDEIFGGYDVYLMDYLREPDKAWPEESFADSKRLEKLQTTGIAAEKMFRTWTGHNGAQVPEQLRSEIPAFAASLAMPPIALAPWTSCFRCPLPQVTMIENIDERTRNLMRTKWHPLHGAQYLWNKTALPNMLLTNLSDRTEMSHSVEGRVPFLDHNLMEYVNNLPPSIKLRYDPETDSVTEKWILRQASRPFITDELYTRKKHPYTAPVVFAVGGPMHQLMTKLITQENVEALGFVDWNGTKDQVEKAFSTQDQVMLRSAFGIAQWIVLGKRFGISKAVKPDW